MHIYKIVSGPLIAIFVRERFVHIGSIMINMNKYTAVIQRDGDFWIGWIEEICGVNSQGATREELLENLQSALQEALQMNRHDARSAAGSTFEEVQISA